MNYHELVDMSEWLFMFADVCHYYKMHRMYEGSRYQISGSFNTYLNLLKNFLYFFH